MENNCHVCFLCFQANPFGKHFSSLPSSVQKAPTAAMITTCAFVMEISSRTMIPRYFLTYLRTLKKKTHSHQQRRVSSMKSLEPSRKQCTTTPSPCLRCPVSWRWAISCGSPGFSPAALPSSGSATAIMSHKETTLGLKQDVTNTAVTHSALGVNKTVGNHIKQGHEIWKKMPFPEPLKQFLPK